MKNFLMTGLFLFGYQLAAHAECGSGDKALFKTLEDSSSSCDKLKIKCSLDNTIEGHNASVMTFIVNGVEDGERNLGSGTTPCETYETAYLKNEGRDTVCEMYLSQKHGVNSQCAGDTKAGDVEAISGAQVDVSTGDSNDRISRACIDHLKDADIESSDLSALTTFSLDDENVTDGSDKIKNLLTINACNKIFPGTVTLRGGKDLSGTPLDDSGTKTRFCLAQLNHVTRVTSSDSCSLDSFKTACKSDTLTSEDDCNQFTAQCADSSSALEGESFKHALLSCNAFRKARLQLKNSTAEEGPTAVDSRYFVTQENIGGFVNGGFQCAKGGLGTALDYQSCKSALNAIEIGHLGGDVAGEIGVELYGQVQNSNNQNNLAAGVASGGTGAQEATFKAAKNQYIIGRDQAIARSAIQGTQGTSILFVKSSYVTSKGVYEKWCQDGEQIPEGTDGAEALTQGEACAIAALSSEAQLDNSENNTEQGASMLQAFFPNRHVISLLSSKAIENFSKSAVSAVTAALQDRQAKLVDGVIDEFQNASFNQPITGIGFDDLPTFCSENPTAPSCADGSATSGTGGGLNLDFGNIGAGGNPVSFDSDSGLTDAQIQELGEATTADIPGVGDLGTGASSDKGNSDFNPIAAGNVSSSRRSGGGGGGGGGSGGGGGGGAGPAPGKKGGSGAPATLGEKTNVKFGSGSSSGFTAGKSGRKSKSKKAPFAGITGSQKRALASSNNKDILPKDIRLFQAISNRYTEVKQSGRLKTK